MYRLSVGDCNVQCTLWVSHCSVINYVHGWTAEYSSNNCTNIDALAQLHIPQTKWYCKTSFFVCPLFREFREPGKLAKITGRGNLNTVTFQCSRKQKCQNYGVQHNYIDSNAKIKGSTAVGTRLNWWILGTVLWTGRTNHDSHRENKKLRYREEHSASVVLSWCTSWHFSGENLLIANQPLLHNWPRKLLNLVK